MPDMTTDEPVQLSGLINAALLATINLLGLILNWDVAVVAGLNLVVGAWVLVAMRLVRARVTPWPGEPDIQQEFA